MTRRNIELVLLCVAAPFVVLLFAMVAVNQGSPLTLDHADRAYRHVRWRL